MAAFCFDHLAWICTVFIPSCNGFKCTFLTAQISCSLLKLSKSHVLKDVFASFVVQLEEKIWSSLFSRCQKMYQSSACVESVQTHVMSLPGSWIVTTICTMSTGKYLCPRAGEKRLWKKVSNLTAFHFA